MLSVTGDYTHRILTSIYRFFTHDNKGDVIPFSISESAFRATNLYLSSPIQFQHQSCNLQPVGPEPCCSPEDGMLDSVRFMHEGG